MAVPLLNKSDLVIKLNYSSKFYENIHSFHSPTFLTNVFTFYSRESST